MRHSSRLLAEGFGTMFLLMIIVGSGIMGERLAEGSAAFALLANSAATAAGLYVLITVFGPVSGAHFNPLVTIAMWAKCRVEGIDALGYIAMQIIGAIAGVVLANVMFDLPPIKFSEKVRTGTGVWVSETIATAGLVLTILLAMRTRPKAIPALVGAYIGAAYWFTASTSFANPAVTLARSMTATFTGIRPADVLAFVIAQCIGAVLGVIMAAMVLQPDSDAQLLAATTDSPRSPN